jgi:hypothetical protein
MESTLKWTIGKRRGDSWLMYKVLEHIDVVANTLYWYWKLSVQFDVFKKCQWNCFYSWIFIKSNNTLEIPNNVKSCNSNRTYLQSFIFKYVSRWLKYSDRSRWWNSEILECLPQQWWGYWKNRKCRYVWGRDFRRWII